MKCLHLAVVGLMLLTGCGTYDLVMYGSVDPSAKSITVPEGGSGLTGKIKAMLQAEGWTLVVDRGPKVTEGSLGTKTHLETYDSSNTRYQLRMWYLPVPGAIMPHGQRAYNYDISIVDSSTGSEVLTLSGGNGAGEENVIVDRLRDALRIVKHD